MKHILVGLFDELGDLYVLLPKVAISFSGLFVALLCFTCNFIHSVRLFVAGPGETLEAMGDLAVDLVLLVDEFEEAGSQEGDEGDEG